MLRVKTRVAHSAIAGLGLFAEEDIQKDQIVYEWSPGFEQVFAQAEVDQMSQLQKDFLRHYSFLRDGTYVVSIDDDRFINHRPTPNTYEKGPDTYALRFIPKGEEITADYFAFDGNADQKIGHLNRD